MKTYLKYLVFIPFAFSFINAEGQWGQLGRLFRKPAKPSSLPMPHYKPLPQYIPGPPFTPEVSRSNQALLSGIDPKLLEKLKKAHPNQDLNKVEFTLAEHMEITSAKYWRDRPTEKADLEWKKKEEQFKKQLNAPSRTKLFRVLPTTSNYVTEVETYISIPSTLEEYEMIFKTKDQAGFKSTRDIYTKLQSDNLKNYKVTSSATNLIKSVSKESRKPMTIIGHNENGLLFFPDGSSVAVSQIDKAAKKSRRVVVYLSCNAAAYTENPAVNYFLSYSEALSLNKYIIDQLKFVSPSSTEKEVTNRIQAMMYFFKYVEKRKQNLRVTAYVVGGGAAGYGLYTIKQENKGDKKPV
jgi:hypothetical protein